MARLRGCVWLLAGVVIAALAGLMGYLYLVQAAEAPAAEVAVVGPQVSVVVAARRAPVRALLTADDLRLVEMPVELAPEGALPSVEDGVGRITLIELYPGEPVLMQRLVDPNAILADGRTALALAENEVLMAFPADDLLTSLSTLRPGDRVDLHLSLMFPMDPDLAAAPPAGQPAGAVQEREELVTFAVLQNVGVAALPGQVIAEPAPAQPNALGAVAQEVREPQPPHAVLFALAPQDALVLRHVMDRGAIQSIVLRAPGVDAEFELEPVHIEYLIHRFNIPTDIGR